MNSPLIVRDVLPSTSRNGLFNKEATSARLRQFSRGETVYEPGMAEFVGYVVSGAVKLVTLLPDGRSNIVGLIEAPGFFGRIFGVATEFSIEAASDVVLACFDRSRFEAQLHNDPELERFIHMENLHQLDEAHERIIVLACQSIMERIATFMVLKLLATVEDSGRTAAPIIHVPINRRDFAAYLGTTVETVSRTVQALVRRGTIAVIDSANFRILRRGDLIDIAGQDEDNLIEMVRSRGSKRVGRQFFGAADGRPSQRDATGIPGAPAMRIAAE
jgi:CRP/FNR family transcriptional regulator, anaerobic regulatory protein